MGNCNCSLTKKTITIKTSKLCTNKSKKSLCCFSWQPQCSHFRPATRTTPKTPPPAADKYPSISPYAYCALNPVKLVDPNGLFADDPPTSLRYIIRKGDSFWSLENEWNLPHGTLQEINPSSDPHNLQVGQVINAAKLDNDFIVVGNDAPIPNERELKTPNEEGPSGLITLTSSEDFLQFRMAFEAILPSLGGEFSGFMQKSGRSLTKNTSWQYGHNHSMIKWNNEFKKRGWSESQVSKTIKNGKSTPATNKVNPGNKATRYMNKNTGKSVVIDKKSRELLHVGSKDFKYD